MKIRGERECKACGARWSYYDTGNVVCPECGSLRSVGVDERRRHTASAAEFDLSPIRGLLDEAPVEDVADRAASACSEYVRRTGFIDAGELRPLDETDLAARELRHVATEIGRSLQVSDDEEYYFLELLRGADEGERPPADEVPASLREARGLAAAAAVDDYSRDLRRYLEDHPERTVSRLLGTLGEHRKRVEALGGDVSPRTADALVEVARALGRAAGSGDETALAEAQERLDDLTIGA